MIETGTGNCHIYVDETADLAMAVQITDNGKTQRPSVCNALETCLVHEAVAEQFLPMLQQKLEEHQVEIRGCERTRQCYPGNRRRLCNGIFGLYYLHTRCKFCG